MAVEVGTLSSTAESRPGVAAVVQLRFGVEAIVPFCAAPGGSAIPTDYDSAGPAQDRNRGALPRFPFCFVHGAHFPAGAHCCALLDSCAYNRRRCGGNSAGPREGAKATAHACFASTVADEKADLVATRGTDAVAVVPKRKTKQRSTNQRLSLQGWLFVPQVIFIHSDQFIEISNHVVVLRIDFCHHIRFALKRLLRHKAMRGDCHSYQDNCHGRCGDESPHVNPC